MALVYNNVVLCQTWTSTFLHHLYSSGEHNIINISFITKFSQVFTTIAQDYWLTLYHMGPMVTVLIPWLHLSESVGYLTNVMLIRYCLSWLSGSQQVSNGRSFVIKPVPYLAHLIQFILDMAIHYDSSRGCVALMTAGYL